MKVNEEYLKLSENYLFSTIAKKVAEYEKEHPEKEIIRLGIGDVTQPLCAPVIEALQKATEEMAHAETFRGYAPDKGYAFLREAIAEHDFKSRGASVDADEIFVSDGAKSDSGNIQEIFAQDNTVAVCDPVYPVYADTNVMAGRKIVFLPCNAENGFVPELPKENVDLIYLCYPNNPTGGVITKAQLQEFVNYANRTGAVIIYDAAYEAYITDPAIPHSIYECKGAKTAAIELRSFSKNAGFTGLRLGYTVVPKELIRQNVSLHSLWARRHSTKFNGAPYIVQRAGEAVYSQEGKKAVKEQVRAYMENASIILRELKALGYTVYGGENAPYIWLKTKDHMTSWEFFDYLLSEAGVVGTPGSGFGKCGESYFRLTAFSDRENTQKAMERIRGLSR